MPDVLEQPAPTPDRPPSEALADFDKTFADLEPTPEPTPEPAPTPDPTPKPAPTGRPKDPETGKFVKTEPVAMPEPQKEPQKPTPTATGSDFEPPQVAKPSELRNWAKRMGSRAETAEQQLSRLNQRIKQLEANPQQQSDVRAITEELATTKKRLQEYEGELKVTRYERSGEYKEKYEKPYHNAVQNAYSEVGELLVNVPNPEDPENPRERQATPQDFDEVYALPLGPATKLAKQKFGDAASIVISHVKAIKDASKAALGAVKDHKGKAAEFEQQQTAQQKMIEEGRSRMFGEAAKAIGEKYPNLFAEREGDTAWNESLAKGRNMADLAYSDRKSLSPAQSAILDAQIYARVSAFPGLRQENDKLKADVAKLTKEIEEIRGSAPGRAGGGAPKPETGTDNLTMEQAFDKMVPA